MASTTRLKRRPATSSYVLSAYAEGVRSFHELALDGADFAGADLTGASFYYASLRGANLSNASLIHVQFKGADLTGANLAGSSLAATDLIAGDFTEASLEGADLTGAAMQRAVLSRANLKATNINGTILSEASLDGAELTGARLFSAKLLDQDLAAFLDAEGLEHGGLSYIDARSVMRSHRDPRLKQFMVDCGVPDIFAEYMIECARALDEPFLQRLMQSTFISYGGPDEKFARKLYEALKKHAITVFFFPETARLGERINNEVFRRIQEHDRVLLLCSEDSLTRAGVINEIQETLDREARDGGATYLLPVMLDDFVLTGWRTTHPHLAERIGRRVIGDFRGATRSRLKFEAALARVIDALKLKRPSD